MFRTTACFTIIGATPSWSAAWLIFHLYLPVNTREMTVPTKKKHHQYSQFLNKQSVFNIK